MKNKLFIVIIIFIDINIEYEYYIYRRKNIFWGLFEWNFQGFVNSALVHK
jgi:hypothetical protein